MMTYSIRNNGGLGVQCLCELPKMLLHITLAMLEFRVGSLYMDLAMLEVRVPRGLSCRVVGFVEGLTMGVSKRG